MKDLTTIDLQSASEEINKLLFDYYMHLSSEAACKDDYVTANSYISILGKSFGDNTSLMNLQAKIYAQQGMFNEAGFLWKKCLKADPNNNNFIRALYRIDQLQNVRVYYRFFWVKLSVVPLMFIAFVFLFSALLTGVNSQSNSLQLISNQQVTVQNKIDSLFNLNSNLPSTTILDEIKIKLQNIDGLNVTAAQEELIVIFNEGLFRKGAKPLKSAATKVIQFAKALEPFTGRITLTILGCSDNVPIVEGKSFQNNLSLNLSRSLAVCNLISINSRMLSEDILSGNLGGDKIPFKNDSYANRLKNRTVVIRIGIKKLS